MYLRTLQLSADERTSEWPSQTASLAWDFGMCLDLLTTARFLTKWLPEGLWIFKLVSANKSFLKWGEKAVSLERASEHLSAVISFIQCPDFMHEAATEPGRRKFRLKAQWDTSIHPAGWLKWKYRTCWVGPGWGGRNSHILWKTTGQLIANADLVIQHFHTYVDPTEMTTRGQKKSGNTTRVPLQQCFLAKPWTKKKQQNSKVGFYKYGIFMAESL